MDKKALKYITTTDNYTTDSNIVIDNTTYIYDINYNIYEITTDTNVETDDKRKTHLN